CPAARTVTAAAAAIAITRMVLVGRMLRYSPFEPADAQQPRGHKCDNRPGGRAQRSALQLKLQHADREDRRRKKECKRYAHRCGASNDHKLAPTNPPPPVQARHAADASAE